MRKLLAFAVALAASASPLLAQDLVKFKDPAKNPVLEGEIVSMTSKVVEVEVLVDGVRIKRTADPRDIAELVPSNARKTLDYLRGEEALLNRDFPTAILRFERVVADTRAAELIRQTAGIQIVRAGAAAENGAGTPLAAQTLRARKPDGFFVRESYQLEIQSLLSARKPEAAAAALKAFAAQGNAQAMQDWIRSADLLDAALAEQQLNWRGALGTYRRQAKDPEAAEDAALGELRCLSALADWPGLRARADALIKKAVSPRLLVAAYTGLGDAETGVGRFKDALLDYLQAALVQARGETGREHEAATARSAITCAALAAKATDPAVKSAYRSKGQELLQDLRAGYPFSSYRPGIEKALREIR